MNAIATGITKARNGWHTAWGKAHGHTYADATIKGCNLDEARRHVAGMRAACENVADPQRQAEVLYAYQKANRP